MRMRKGFTLIELLIIIAIIGVLAAMMTVSMGDSITSAKVATILNNIASVKTAGLRYYSDHMNDAATESTAFTNTTLADSTNFYIDIDKFASTNTKYTASGTAGVGNANTWVITCDFNGEPDKVKIGEIIKKNPAYSDITFADKKYGVKVTILTGKAELMD